MKLPKYINCKNNTEPCEWYMHKACKETCPYALDIKGLGCGAIDLETAKGLEVKLLKEKE